MDGGAGEPLQDREQADLAPPLNFHMEAWVGEWFTTPTTAPEADGRAASASHQLQHSGGQAQHLA